MNEKRKSLNEKQKLNKFILNGTKAVEEIQRYFLKSVFPDIINPEHAETSFGALKSGW